MLSSATVDVTAPTPKQRVNAIDIKKVKRGACAMRKQRKQGAIKRELTMEGVSEPTEVDAVMPMEVGVALGSRPL